MGWIAPRAILLPAWAASPVPWPPPPQQDQGAGEQDDVSKISTGLKLLCFDFDCVGSDLRHLAVREVVDVT